MRHRKDGRKLGRTASHRKAMLANMAANLFLHKQIRTTHEKALETRRFVETLITKAKRGDLHSRRLVLQVIPHKDVVKILFDEIAPQYMDRQGGYTRIIKLGQRKNDAARVSLLSLVDFDPSGSVGKAAAKDKKKKSDTPPAKPTAKTEVTTEPVVESVEEVAEEVAEVVVEEAEVVEAEVAESEVVEEAPADEASTEESADSDDEAEKA